MGGEKWVFSNGWMVISGKQKILREKSAECQFTRHEYYVNPLEIEPYAAPLEASAVGSQRLTDEVQHDPLY
jgi:hypothetical protein